MSDSGSQVMMTFIVYSCGYQRRFLLYLQFNIALDRVLAEQESRVKQMLWHNILTGLLTAELSVAGYGGPVTFYTGDLTNNTSSCQYGESVTKLPLVQFYFSQSRTNIS